MTRTHLHKEEIDPQWMCIWMGILSKSLIAFSPTIQLVPLKLSFYSFNQYVLRQLAALNTTSLLSTLHKAPTTTPVRSCQLQLSLSLSISSNLWPSLVTWLQKKSQRLSGAGRGRGRAQQFCYATICHHQWRPFLSETPAHTQNKKS